MHEQLIQHLRSILKIDAFDSFMQNMALYCSVEDVRGMGLKDEDIKKLRAKNYKANAARANMKWWDEEEDNDDGEWEFTNNDGAVRIFIQGPIDSWFGVDAPDIVRKLRAADTINSIHIDIESPGGFVSEGLALYHELKAQQRKKVPITTETRGLVASAAMDIFVAGNRRIATQHSMMMIHAPWAFIFMAGNMWDIEAGYNGLMNSFKVFTQNGIDILADNVDGLEKSRVEEWFKAGDKWMDENEAVEIGFATEVADVPESDDEPEPVATEPTAQQHDDGEGAPRRETPNDPPPTHAPQEIPMKLSAERQAKIRKALSIADDIEITEDHVEQFMAKEEAEREDENMQREIAETARIRSEVESELKPFYDAGFMSQAQRQRWTGTIMQADDPREHLATVVGQLKDTFGDPAAAPAAADPQQRVDADPAAAAAAASAAAAAAADADTPIEKARARFKQICDDGGNTINAFKLAYRRVKEEYGLEVLRELQTSSKINTKGAADDTKSKAFRQELTNANGFQSLINDDEVQNVRQAPLP